MNVITFKHANGAPNFVALAASYGLEAVDVTSPDELKEVLEA